MRTAVRRYPHLHRHRQALDPRCEAAGVAREREREHRLDGPRHIHAVPAGVGLDLQGRAGTDMRGDVRDVDPQANTVTVGLRRDRVVEVPCGRGVDRERIEGGQVTPAGRIVRTGGVRRQGRLQLDGLREPALEPRLPDHRPHDVRRPLGRAQLERCAVTTCTGLDQHHRAGGARAAGKWELRARVEERLDNAGLAALADHADERLRSLASRRHQLASSKAPSSRRPASRPSSAGVSGSSEPRRVGVHTLVGQRLALRGDVLADREVQCASGGQADDLLDRVLPVGAGSDQRRQAVVLKGGRQDLGGGGGIAVDEDDGRLRVERLTRGLEVPVPGCARGGRDHDAVLHERPG